jgi:hypothetical protein
MYLLGNKGFRGAETVVRGYYEKGKKAKVGILGGVLEALERFKLCEGYEYEEHLSNCFFEERRD